MKYKDISSKFFLCFLSLFLMVSVGCSDTTDNNNTVGTGTDPGTSSYSFSTISVIADGTFAGGHRLVLGDNKGKYALDYTKSVYNKLASKMKIESSSTSAYQKDKTKYTYPNMTGVSSSFSGSFSGVHNLYAIPGLKPRDVTGGLGPVEQADLPSALSHHEQAVYTAIMHGAGSPIDAVIASKADLVIVSVGIENLLRSYTADPDDQENFIDLFKEADRVAMTKLVDDLFLSTTGLKAKGIIANVPHLTDNAAYFVTVKTLLDSINFLPNATPEDKKIYGKELGLGAESIKMMTADLSQGGSYVLTMDAYTKLKKALTDSQKTSGAVPRTIGTTNKTLEDNEFLTDDEMKLIDLQVDIWNAFINDFAQNSPMIGLWDVNAMYDRVVKSTFSNSDIPSVNVATFFSGDDVKTPNFSQVNVLKLVTNDLIKAINGKFKSNIALIKSTE